MKNVILASLVALGLAAAFFGYATVSYAGGSTVNGSYMDDQAKNPVP